MAAVMHANGLMSPPPTEKASSAGSPARVVLAGKTGRILCVADIRGDFHELNRLIREHEATAVIHTGDFGFINAESLDRMGDKILRHLLQYSPLLPPSTRQHLLSIPASAGRAALITALNNSSVHFPLSQFPHLLTGAITFPVPVFTVWGLIEDVRVLEKFRTGEYEVANLSVIDEAASKVLDVGGLRLRLFGLGGAVAPHKMFDNGEGFATIAGGQGTMWTTALQIGELVDTAQRVYDATETRLFISSAPISRNGLLSQLSSALKADLTISGGLHFRYPASFNEFAVHGDFEAYRSKLNQSRETFVGVYQSVKDKVDSSLNENQLALLRKALGVAQKVPETDDGTWTNTWHWVLSDASCGHMLFSITDGRVSAETKSSGLNFSHRAANHISPKTASVNLPQPQGTPIRPPASTTAPETSIKPPPSAPAAAATSAAVRPAPSPAVRPPGVTATGTRPPVTGPAGSYNASIRPPGPMRGGFNQRGGLPARPAGLSDSNATLPTAANPTAPTAPAVRPAPQNVPRGPKGPFAPAANTPPAPSAAKPAEKETKPQQTPKNAASASKPAATPVPVEKNGDTAKDASASAGVEGKADDKSAAAATPAANGTGEKKQRPEPRTEKSSASITPDEKANGTPAAAAAAAARPKTFDLFARGFNVPVTDEELKSLFPGFEDKVTNIKVPVHHIPGGTGKQKDMAYVEFATEEDQLAALAATTKKIGEKDVSVVISTPNRAFAFARGRGGFRGANGGGRGMRGGGRGGRGGAAAASGGGEGGGAATPAAAPAASGGGGGEGKKD